MSSRRTSGKGTYYNFLAGLLTLVTLTSTLCSCGALTTTSTSWYHRGSFGGRTVTKTTPLKSQRWRGRQQRRQHGLSMSLVGAMGQVNDIIKNNKVVLFGVSDEPQTRRIKFLFDDADVEYTSVDVDLISNGANVMKAINTLCGQSTVPVFFIAGRYVGNHEAILRMNMDGYLGEILEEVGALPIFGLDELKKEWSGVRQSVTPDEEGGLI